MPRAISPILKSLSVTACGFAVFSLPGCNTPSKANIELRRDIERLNGEVAQLKTQRTGGEATIRALQNKTGVQPAISQDLTEKLFTVHGIQLGRLTGPDNWDPSHPSDDGLRVWVVPVDEQGDKLKAAGTFTVQAFDLANPAKPLVGEWRFDVKQSREAWHGGTFGYAYALRAPWQQPPLHNELTVKVTFVDELTGREFTAQKVVKVTPQPPTTQPASTAPAPAS